jgi:hypothetical protein
MEETKRIAAADLVMGVLLVIFGGYLIEASLKMKVYRTFLDAPGFFPLLLDVFLLSSGDDDVHRHQKTRVPPFKTDLFRRNVRSALQEYEIQTGHGSYRTHGRLYFRVDRTNPFHDCDGDLSFSDLYLLEIDFDHQNYHHFSRHFSGNQQPVYQSISYSAAVAGT